MPLACLGLTFLICEVGLWPGMTQSKWIRKRTEDGQGSEVRLQASYSGEAHVRPSGRCFHSCCDRACPAVWQMLSVNCPLLFPTAQALWIRRCQRLGCHQASLFSNRNPVYLQEVFQLSTLGSEAPRGPCLPALPLPPLGPEVHGHRCGPVCWELSACLPSGGHVGWRRESPCLQQRHLWRPQGCSHCCKPHLGTWQRVWGRPRL